MGIRMPSAPQYTEHTRYGDTNVYRISRPGETFAEFMARSPFYSSGELYSANWEEIETMLRMPSRGGKYGFGWSDFTRTAYPARVLANIDTVERLQNSPSGNPRWKLSGSDGSGTARHWVTESDGKLSHTLSNYTNSRRTRTDILRAGRVVTLVLSYVGKVTDIEIDGETMRDRARRIYG